MAEIGQMYLNWMLTDLDMEELELKGETNPKDSVNEIGIFLR